MNGASSVYAYESTYRTARGFASLISLLGWVAVGAGALLLVLSLGALDGQVRSIGLLGLLPAFGCMGAGLVCVAIGQLTRAAVDTADHTGEVLAILRATAATAPARPEAESSNATIPQRPPDSAPSPVGAHAVMFNGTQWECTKCGQVRPQMSHFQVVRECT